MGMGEAARKRKSRGCASAVLLAREARIEVAVNVRDECW